MNDKDFEHTKQAWQQIGNEVKTLFSKSGVSVNVSVNVDRSSDSGNMNKNIPAVQINMQRR